MFPLFTVLSAIISVISSQSSTMMPSSSTSPTQTNVWEDLTVTTVRAITELSRVAIVLSRRDYSLDKSQSYTYISYPSSYRATLTQATDTVERALRTAESSTSRVQMAMGQVPNNLNNILSLLSQGSIQEQKMLLPSMLDSIARMGNDVASAFGQISTDLDKVVAFFEELFRGVQPTPLPSTTSSPSGSTSTQTNKSPLDINHGVTIATILAYFKSINNEWSQLAQYAKQFTSQTSGVLQLLDNRNIFLWKLRDIAQSADLLYSMAAAYNQVSMKFITPDIISINNDLMLDNEEQRLAEVQKVDHLADTRIPKIQNYFSQVMNDYEAGINDRNAQFNSMTSTPSP